MAEEITNACGHHSKLLRILAKNTKTNKRYVVNVFSCIQYKSKIMYNTICIEITLLFIGINKYLSREMFKKNIK
jgi:hypothetical protein